MPILVRRLIAWLAPTLLLLGLAGPAAAQSGNCAALANLHLPDVRITKAEAIPGGASWALPPSPFNIFLGPNPATDARPEVGGMKLERIRMVVLLPAPLGPRKPIISPFPTSKFRLSIAVCPA